MVVFNILFCIDLEKRKLRSERQSPSPTLICLYIILFLLFFTTEAYPLISEIVEGPKVRTKKIKSAPAPAPGSQDYQELPPVSFSYVFSALPRFNDLLLLKSRVDAALLDIKSSLVFGSDADASELSTEEEVARYEMSMDFLCCTDLYTGPLS